MHRTLHAVSSPHPDRLRVLVAEGHGLIRAGFRALIDGEDGMSVAAEAASGEQALAAALDTRPDVMLVDRDLPHEGGAAAVERILAHVDPGATRVVMLLESPSDDAVLAALRSGATGLLLKDAEPADLLDAVRVVATGDALLAPSLARTLVADFLSRPERLSASPAQLEELTPREREVVGLVACGLSNEEIADKLVVTRATAKTHVSRALCKLHARDRAQLVVLAYEAGLVRPGPRRRELRDAIVATPTGRMARPPATKALRRPALRTIAA